MLANETRASEPSFILFHLFSNTFINRLTLTIQATCRVSGVSTVRLGGERPGISSVAVCPQGLHEAAIPAEFQDSETPSGDSRGGTGFIVNRLDELDHPGV